MIVAGVPRCCRVLLWMEIGAKKLEDGLSRETRTTNASRSIGVVGDRLCRCDSQGSSSRAESRRNKRGPTVLPDGYTSISVHSCPSLRRPPSCCGLGGLRSIKRRERERDVFTARERWAEGCAEQGKGE